MSTDHIISPLCRLAFPQLFTPKAAPGSTKEQYSATLIILQPDEVAKLLQANPGLKQLVDMVGIGDKPLRKIAKAALVEKWGEDRTKWPVKLRAIDLGSATEVKGWPFRNGDEYLNQRTGEPYQGFGGHTFIRAASQYKPGVVDANVQPILDQSQIWGGLICVAQINAYPYDTAGNQGSTFGLSNLQVVMSDGVKWSGGAPDPANAFKAWNAADSADNPANYAATGTDGADDL